MLDHKLSEAFGEDKDNWNPVLAPVEGEDYDYVVRDTNGKINFAANFIGE